MKRSSQELATILLQFAASRLQDRDAGALAELGFGPAEIQALSDLKLIELANVAHRLPHGLMRIELDRHAFHLLINKVRQDGRTELSMELIRHDAPVDMVQRLFGIGARDFAKLRSLLELPPIVGRPAAPTEDESSRIWQAWSELGLDDASLATADHWLSLARKTGLSAGMIWRLVWKWYGGVTP